MSEPIKPETTQTTVGWLLSVLREGKTAQVRARKAKAQTEFMIARRMLQQTYRDMDPTDLPVDLHRLRRDLEITRDQEIADATEEIEQAYAITQSVIMSVADRHPAFYKEPVDQSAGVGAPEKVARYLHPNLMAQIAGAIDSARDGLTVREVCEVFSLAEATQRLATKRYLGWLRTSGHLRTSGSGKGMRYLATKSLKRLIYPIMQGSKL